MLIEFFSRECFQLLLSPPELEWVEFDFDTNQTLDNKILKRAADLHSFKWLCHLVFNYCLSITIECVFPFYSMDAALFNSYRGIECCPNLRNNRRKSILEKNTHLGKRTNVAANNLHGPIDIRY